MSGEFQTYSDYVFLKQHFSDSVFIWDESFQYNIKEETFLKRRDKRLFYNLYWFYKNRKSIIDHLISCFLYDSNFWIGDALKDEYISRHHDRMKRIGSLKRTFVDDCEKIERYFDDHKIIFTMDLTPSLNSPMIMKLYPKEISLETLAIVHRLTGFIETWFPINPLQKWRRMLIYKYSFLINFEDYNEDVFRTIFQKLIR